MGVSQQNYWNESVLSGEPNTVSGVLASDPDEQPLVRAIEQLQRTGYRHFQTFSPIPGGKLSEFADSTTSPIRRYTLAGGILGFISGFVLTIGTALQWRLVIGGKPVVSVPPYLVITFELTVLFAGLLTIVGVLIHGPLGWRRPSSVYSPAFSANRFGVFVPCRLDLVQEVTNVFQAAGVEEIRIEGS